ncbi:multi drug resistance-associated protein MRP [Lobosporangium transversale]|uniref:Multi drug resistance-associated protein MRP n=1 Tax=Lobosporangium transversale TaxID=64571 RepID=A0A1Y2H1A2_9FUNG|nr:multi drug resistance-associated protein MRP [Lobosporangium transversale]ORZ28328.1 multi drug resistance-associated protein MRP [Lobosporangium transversale]|eukprot:XP_021886013.1 multi drug resistance-associated protein MRP [Lobosporangium transversale]
MVLLEQTSQHQFIAFAAYFALNTLGFIVEAWPRGRTQAQRKSNVSRFSKANLCSRATFHYLQPIVSLGYRNPLSIKDIAGMMPDRIQTAASHSRLNRTWEYELEKQRTHGRKPSLFRAILKASGRDWIPVMVFRLLASTFIYILPQLLKELLAFINSYQTPNPQPLPLGIILSFGMFFTSILSSFFMAQYFQWGINVGIQARTGLIAMVYRKSLKLSSAAKQKSTAGEITNHMSVDAEKWADASVFLPMLLSTPFELAIAIWMLYLQISWSVFVGLATVLALTPIQGMIAKFYMKAKERKLEAMDERVRLMNELLTSIKVIKLYGWSDSFRERVTYYRNREVATLRKIGVVFSFMSIMFQSVPLLVALVSFAVFATHGGPDFGPGDINPQRVFVSITLFGLLNRPIGMLSHVLAEAIGVRVAAARIQKFLLAEEISESTVESIKSLPDDPSVPLIQVKDGVFAWDLEGPVIETEKERKAREKLEAKKQKELEKEVKKAGKPLPEKIAPFEKNYGPTLVDINLEISRGDLTAVVGRVGQGKSSLLNAIIGDMYKRQGSVKVYGRLAYVPQQAWIVNATLKDNILFGNEFDQARYDHVVMSCGLLPDIAMLPGGDQTEIGERGINLSGGQKQRVSLARAAYENADVYLLDDPLSAVDAHVDQHLWQNLIGPTGLLKDKTRILVTHAIHHLEHVDRIVVMRDGRIAETGEYSTLMDAKASLYQLITDYSVNQAKKRNEKKGGEDSVAQDDEDCSTRDGNEKEDEVNVKKDDKAELVSEEKMVFGSVSFNVYKIYCKAASYKWSLAVVTMFVLGQAFQIGTNLWLKYWSSVAGQGNHTVGEFLGVYAALIFAYMIANVASGYTTMVLAAIRASTRLHDRLLTKMLRLPMSFFDTTPLGRVVNRFSGDIFSIDELTPWNFINVLLCACSVLATIIVIATTTPVFLALVPPLVIVYILTQNYYLRTSRQLKRIDSVSKSPIYQHFSETLSGVTTIRALRANERFIKENASKADQAANAFFSWVVANRWLQIRLELLGATIVLASALFACLSRNTLGSGSVGLALSYALAVTQDITWLVRSYCDLQNQLVAVERVDEYANKNPEAPDETDAPLPENWPQHGRVEFRNYSARYREGLDLVIKNISFTVEPAEKVGICGRTGAGKSSLTLALFRIIEAANSHWAKASHNGVDKDLDSSKGKEKQKEKREQEGENEIKDLEKVEVEEDGGSIWIDGVDISTVGLTYLRQHLAIIPQDPTLFVGTIRENLDPFGELQDADLWEALERAHLKDHISSLAGGLSFKVSQNGDNFSVGQRSLICLARALLRKSKILILDEATAAVDVETDELIQKTIRKEFKDRTILTIAHRIKTIMDSDKILVLEKGRVEEYESPRTLLQRPSSLFYKLAQQAGEIKDAD